MVPWEATRRESHACNALCQVVPSCLVLVEVVGSGWAPVHAWNHGLSVGYHGGPPRTAAMPNWVSWEGGWQWPTLPSQSQSIGIHELKAGGEVV